MALIAASAALPSCDLVLGIKSLEVEEAVGPDTGPFLHDNDADSGHGEDAGVAEAGDDASDGGADASCEVHATSPATPTIVTISGGGNGWSSTDGVKAEDGAVAVATGCCSGDDSQVLTALGFDLSVPDDAEVRGVKVEIRLRQASGPVDWMSDRIVRLTPDPDGIGEDLKSPTFYPYAFETREYGGPTSLWGLALSPSVVNSASFGVVFRTGHRAGAAASAELDVIRVTVFYCR